MKALQPRVVGAPARISLFLAVLLIAESAGGVPRAKTQAPSAPQGRKGSGLRYVERNLYAPEFYAEKLEARIALVDLPGGAKRGSEWQMSFQLYFISESDFWKVVEETLTNGRQITNASDFPKKTLLASATFDKRNLETIRDRTYQIRNVGFKRKIPDGQRTKFANLLMVFSTKIYDAQLQLSIYRNGFFLTSPFIEDSTQQKDIPRTVLFTNLYVSEKGELFTSQWPRLSDDTTWRHP